MFGYLSRFRSESQTKTLTLFGKKIIYFNQKLLNPQMIWILDNNTDTNLYYRYDFNSDGLISREDVRIILSYIPYNRTAAASYNEKIKSI